MDKAIWYDWNGGNVWLFKLINGINGGNYYDLAMRQITMLGDKKILPYLLAVVAAYALTNWIYKIIAKKGGSKHYAIMWISCAIVFAASFACTYITTNTLKNHFAYPRPYVALASNEVHLLVSPTEENGNQSFPSGHVTIIATLIFAIWPLLGEGFRVFGAATIFAVAWSRIALGVHFPVDVLASFFICLIEVYFVRGILHSVWRTLFGARI